MRGAYLYWLPDVPGRYIRGRSIMSVGDVTSNVRGSGARFNEGKPELDLIPPYIFQTIYQDKIQSLSEDFSVAISYVLEVLEMVYRGEHHLLEESLKMLNDWTPEAARVFTYGKKKYAAWNWAKGMPWSVPVGCIMRHIVAILDGEEFDRESNWHHMAHVMCNLIMLYHFMLHYPEGNDLPDPSVIYGGLRGQE